MLPRQHFPTAGWPQQQTTHTAWNIQRHVTNDGAHRMSSLPRLPH
uniref:Uncharacterized protein n=1 Tax=Arundo donax TaxID=35708 RepID=A0A0A9CC96_ARUDO